MREVRKRRLDSPLGAALLALACALAACAKGGESGGRQAGGTGGGAGSGAAGDAGNAGNAGVGGTAGGAGAAGTAGSAGSSNDAGNIDPVCLSVCEKASALACQGCAPGVNEDCQSRLTNPKCGEAFRAVLNCYLSVAVTCEGEQVVVQGCTNENQTYGLCYADSCASANNGTCEEGGACAPGTDTTDCASARQ